VSTIPDDPDAHAPELKGETLVSDDAIDDLAELVSTIQLIGSPDSARFARSAHQAVYLINMVAAVGVRLSTLRVVKSNYEDAIERYKAAARRELGVEGIVPPSTDATLPPSP